MFALNTVGEKLNVQFYFLKKSQRYWFPILEGYKEFRAIMSLFSYICSRQQITYSDISLLV